MRRFISAYQTAAPLTIGDFGRWPSVRLALVENLPAGGDRDRQSRDERELAESLQTNY